jgi:hypothetical protein
LLVHISHLTFPFVKPISPGVKRFKTAILFLFGRGILPVTSLSGFPPEACPFGFCDFSARPQGIGFFDLSIELIKITEFFEHAIHPFHLQASLYPPGLASSPSSSSARSDLFTGDHHSSL